MESFQPGVSLDAVRSSERPVLVVEPEPEAQPASVVLLAGSFDPITVAHVAVADAAAAATGADLVAFVYAARTLPKEPGTPRPLLEEPTRIETLRRVVASRPRSVLAFASHGLLAEQVEAAAARFPSARLALAVGSDKLLQLLDPRWYEDRDAALDAMFRRAEVLFAMRFGDDDAVDRALTAPENAAWIGRIRLLSVPPQIASVSSRTIRQMLAHGEDASDLVPPEARWLLPRT